MGAKSSEMGRGKRKMRPSRATLHILHAPRECPFADLDFAEMFASAGFKLTRIVPVEGSLVSVLEGVPV